MKILALDSTAKVASAAICDNEKILATFTCNNGLTHSEILLPMAEDCLCRAGIPLSDIEIFACNVGPGSFTGVRIGAAVIKGLAFGKNAPCVAVSTLESLAQNLMPLNGIYCPVMDARRNQVYNAIFTCDNGSLTRLTEDRAISLEELACELENNYKDKPVYLVGDGYDIATRHLSDKLATLRQTPASLIAQNAVSTAICAKRIYESNKSVSDTSLSPTYLRMPSAERERLEKEGKA